MNRRRNSTWALAALLLLMLSDPGALRAAENSPAQERTAAFLVAANALLDSRPQTGYCPLPIQVFQELCSLLPAADPENLAILVFLNPGKSALPHDTARAYSAAGASHEPGQERLFFIVHGMAQALRKPELEQDWYQAAIQIANSISRIGEDLSPSAEALALMGREAAEQRRSPTELSWGYQDAATNWPDLGDQGRARLAINGPGATFAADIESMIRMEREQGTDYLVFLGAVATPFHPVERLETRRRALQGSGQVHDPRALVILAAFGPGDALNTLSRFQMTQSRLK